MPLAVAERKPITTPERGDLSWVARQQLEQHPHFRGRLSGLSIEQRGKSLRLSGRLPTFYLKQLIQETVRHIPGVQRIHNEIAVVNATGMSSEC
jgi:hypothetical protein